MNAAQHARVTGRCAAPWLSGSKVSLVGSFILRELLSDGKHSAQGLCECVICTPEELMEGES